MQNKKYKYVFLVGSAKSGTTKLADLLDLHPQICVSEDKEPDTFADEDVSDALLQKYETLFDQTSDIRVDASTSYSERVDSIDIAKRLYQVDPNARILYLVRNPAKRAWSSYWHYIRNGGETRSPMEAIEDRQGQHFVGSCYHLHVKNYESVFPRDQIRVIEFEDFVKNTESVFTQILTFLGIDSMALDQEDSDATKNKSYQWKGPAAFLKHIDPKYIQKATRILKKTLPDSMLDRIKNSATKPVPSMSDEEYKRLAPLFENDYSTLKSEYSDIFIRSKQN